MISSIIIDDQAFNREVIKEMIEKNLNDQLIVIGEAADIKTGLALIQKLKPDLIFLDIEMPSGSGFEMLEQVKEINFDIIFTTSHDNFALRAIKFSALDYLLKPIKEDELIKAINKCFNKGNRNRNKLNPLEFFLQTMRKLNSVDNEIGLPTIDGSVFVKLAEIVRCESFKNNTNCYLTDDSMIALSCSLKEVEYLLQEAHFIKVNDSTIINLQHVINSIKGDVRLAVLNDGTEVYISKGKEEEFMKKMDELKMVFN